MLSRDDADRATLEALAQAGSKLAEPHTVKHYLYFGTKRRAKAAAREIAASGYRSSAGSIRSTREFREGVANRFGGEYDGWEAQVERLPQWLA